MPNESKVVIHQRTQTKLVTQLKSADSYFSRLKGLMGTATLGEGAGLLITPCQQVHTHFMRYPLDVIFLDKDFRVIFIERNLRPWRISKYVKTAYHALEVAANCASDITPGDLLNIDHS